MTINQTFAGLVVAASAGNAIENVVQIALVLAPVLVPVAQIFGLAPLVGLCVIMATSFWRRGPG